MHETVLAGQTRCPCGSPSPDVRMVECKNPDCCVLQHTVCVRGLHAVPPHFNCEVCRINRADLFSVGTKILLHPTRLEHSEIRVDGTINNFVNLNTEFQIQGRDLHLTDYEGYEVQVWCILLNDAAHFRMHWPK